MVTSLPLKAYRLYRDGFRRMTLGKTLWKIILIKLVILFAVLKLFFFPNYMQENFSSDFQRSDHVLQQLTGSGEHNFEGRMR